MDLLAIGTATTDSNLNIRLNAALQLTARDILNEDPATPDHDQRVDLARSIVRSPGAGTSRFVWHVVTFWSITPQIAILDGALTVDVTDQQIQDAASSAWTTVADWI